MNVQKMDSESIRGAFGIAATSAATIRIGSPDDLLDAFRRFSDSNSTNYSLGDFKLFVSAVVSAGKCDLPGLSHCGDLLSKYVERVPDLGWERCVRQIWPLLSKVKEWVEDDSIPLDRIGVRPVFVSLNKEGSYEIQAFLCDHTVDNCNCGH